MAPVGRRFTLCFLLVLTVWVPACNSNVFLNVDNGRLTLRVTVNPDNLVLVIGGDSQTVVVLVSRQDDSGPVNLSVSGLPAGVTAEIQQPGMLAQGRVTLHADSTAQPQQNLIVGVTASDGTTTDATRFTLEVVPWPGP